MNPWEHVSLRHFVQKFTWLVYNSAYPAFCISCNHNHGTFNEAKNFGGILSQNNLVRILQSWHSMSRFFWGFLLNSYCSMSLHLHFATYLPGQLQLQHFTEFLCPLSFDGFHTLFRSFHFGKGRETTGKGCGFQFYICQLHLLASSWSLFKTPVCVLSRNHSIP